MDLLAHAVYGGTFCSRTGLAGGRTGFRQSLQADWTVWTAAAFGAMPDIVSMGPNFVAYVLSGAHGNFFGQLQAPDLLVYRWMHSLVVSLMVIALLRFRWRSLFVPALGWPLHVVTDALTHGAGRFQTPILYPLSSWGFDSIRWWEHPAVVAAYWLVVPLTWLGLWLWRRVLTRSRTPRARSSACQRSLTCAPTSPPKRWRRCLDEAYTRLVS